MKIGNTRQEEFFIAVDSDLGAVVGAEEGAIEQIPGMKEESPRLG